MNYIKQLQEKNQALESALDAVLEEINANRVFLGGPKFTGECPIDGSRKDWIATSDVLSMFRRIQDAAS